MDPSVGQQSPLCLKNAMLVVSGKMRLEIHNTLKAWEKYLKLSHFGELSNIMLS
jgi:hypothetical protein